MVEKFTLLWRAHCPHRISVIQNCLHRHFVISLGSEYFVAFFIKFHEVALQHGNIALELNTLFDGILGRVAMIEYCCDW